jgi:hypothetical protein
MEHLLLILPALICPLGMGLCMWMMARHMRSSKQSDEAPQVKDQVAEPGEPQPDSERPAVAPALPGPASRL